MGAPIPRMPELGWSDLDQLSLFAPAWSPLVASQNTAPPTERPLETHPAFERLLARVPPSVKATFTQEQMVALASASVPLRQQHAIDYRVSLPFFKKRFYMTILAGKERRSPQRLLADRYMYLSQTRMFHYFLAGTVVLTVCAVLALLGFGISILAGDIGSQSPSSLQRWIDSTQRHRD